MAYTANMALPITTQSSDANNRQRSGRFPLYASPKPQLNIQPIVVRAQLMRTPTLYVPNAADSPLQFAQQVLIAADAAVAAENADSMAEQMIAEQSVQPLLMCEMTDNILHVGEMFRCLVAIAHHEVHQPVHARVELHMALQNSTTLARVVLIDTSIPAIASSGSTHSRHVIGNGYYSLDCTVEHLLAKAGKITLLVNIQYRPEQDAAGEYVVTSKKTFSRAFHYTAQQPFDFEMSSAPIRGTEYTAVTVKLTSLLDRVLTIEDINFNTRYGFEVAHDMIFSDSKKSIILLNREMRSFVFHVRRLKSASSEIGNLLVKYRVRLGRLCYFESPIITLPPPSILSLHFRDIPQSVKSNSVVVLTMFIRSFSAMRLNIEFSIDHNMLSNLLPVGIVDRPLGTLDTFEQVSADLSLFCISKGSMRLSGLRLHYAPVTGSDNQTMTFDTIEIDDIEILIV